MPSVCDTPLRVLVIDDEEEVGNLLQRRLTRRGFEVGFHRGFFGATLAAIAYRPDVLLLDVNMDGLYGSSLLPALRKRVELASCRIVLHSSLDAQELRQRAQDCGADGWLSKTMDFAAFVNEIEKLGRSARSAPARNTLSEG